MEACWEYLACHKVECAMYGRRDIRCWEIEDTCCNNEAVTLWRAALDGRKAEACAQARCIYHEAAMIGRRRIHVDELPAEDGA
jgi:hypothetical protein